MGRRRWDKNARKRELAARYAAHESYLRMKGLYLAAASTVYDEIEAGKLANTPEERVRRFGEVYTEMRGKDLTLPEIEALLHTRATPPAELVVADVAHPEPASTFRVTASDEPPLIVNMPQADPSLPVVIHTPGLVDFGLIPSPPPDPGLPEAHDGCQCLCHRHPGVMHCVPCCYPGRPSFEHTDDRVPRRIGECAGAEQVQGDGVP